MIRSENLRSGYIQDDVEDYLYTLLPERDQVVKEMEDYAEEHDVPIIGPAVARLLTMLVQASGAKRIFEMGSAIGYSTVWLARAAGTQGKVFYTDGDREKAKRAEVYFRMAGVAKRVQTQVGALTDSGVSALQTDVTVSQWSLTGQGRLVARIEGALYNDGSNGSGTAPDINRPGSQVGDVLASISMNATIVSSLVIRCDAANCSSFTPIHPPTTLGSVTLGSPHTLLLWWDPSSHKINFQLDDRPPATFDPVAASHPVVSAPSVPFRQIAVRAGPINPTDTFTGSIIASFDNVKTM